MNITHIMKFGPVRITREQDYRLFMQIVTITCALAIALTYAYIQGHMAFLYGEIGPIFFWIFAAIFVFGIYRALDASRKVSYALNRLKKDALDSQEIKQFFGVETFHNVEIRYLEREVRNKLALLTEKVKYPSVVAVRIGLLGTMMGIAFALQTLAGARKPEEVIALFPEMSAELSLAFYTTITGIVLLSIQEGLYRFVRSGAVDLSGRIFRSLHELKAQEGTS